MPWPPHTVSDLRTAPTVPQISPLFQSAGPEFPAPDVSPASIPATAWAMSTRDSALRVDISQGRRAPIAWLGR